MGGGVLPGFRCRGSSLGWDGERVVSGCLSCHVVHNLQISRVLRSLQTLQISAKVAKPDGV